MEVILATSNPGKVKEFREALKDFDVKILTLADLDFTDEIIEDGKTFRENALIKAKTIYDLYKKPVIADDSGLCCYGLNLAPGIYSARYGNLKTDQERSLKLLKALEKLENRKAYFNCTIVFYNGLEPFYFEGQCEGEIAKEFKGHNGFGYDPIFKLPDGRHMGELTKEEKLLVSHRGKAILKLKEWFHDSYH